MAELITVEFHGGRKEWVGQMCFSFGRADGPPGMFSDPRGEAGTEPVHRTAEPPEPPAASRDAGQGQIEKEHPARILTARRAVVSFIR
jgi:hypothetical protein